MKRGHRWLKVHFDDSMDTEDIALLTGRIAYDISVWHEIATWYGASYLPLIPEGYSSFSFEDGYSNMLGVILVKAICSPLSYNQAMTELLNETLIELEGSARFGKGDAGS